MVSTRWRPFDDGAARIYSVRAGPFDPEISMTSTTAVLLAAALLVASASAQPAAAQSASPQPASPQVVDLSTIKCKEFLDSGKETIGYIMMWLDGYYTGEDDPAIVDFDKMKQKGEKLGEYCAKNPAHGLLTAAEEVMGR
jgi:acid stress chaperone HdeB